MICICTLGSLIHGKVTEQKTFVFAVTGVLTLLSCPPCFSPSQPSPKSHSVKMSTHISANYTESRGWQTSSVKAKLELCCAGPSRLRVWLECFTVDTTPPQRRCLQLLSAGWIVDGYRRKALTGGSLGPHSHPQPWQGAALVSLFYFWTGGLTASLLATRFSWFLKTGSLPQPFFGY